jgi:glyoxylase-like metal-dependent hydrolase (beta-lactamase superfamily II)
LLKPIANGVYRVELPLPWPPWTVNSYIIDDSSLTLIDVGAGNEESQEILETGLGDLGYSIKEVDRIIITHAHIDHYGLGTTVTKFSSAKVYFHSYEKDRLLSRMDKYWKQNQKRICGFFDELDLPEEVLKHFQTLVDQYCDQALPFEARQIKELSHRQKIPFDNFTLEVIHLPGHSPGHIALCDTKKRFIFSGDLLLIKSLPSPVIDLDWGSPWVQHKGMVAQLNSLKKLEALKVKQVFPGHWEPFEQAGYFIGQFLKGTAKFQKEILSLVGREEKTIYELTRETYGGMSDMAMFNYLPEVFGAISLLISQGKVLSEVRGGKAFYRAT